MLLDDIINLATDDKQSITTLLRKCLILASQIKNERLRTWANQELNGYDSAEAAPEYRKMTAQAKGNFAGGWGAYFGDRNIPSAAMDPSHRWAATDVVLTQPVRAYESVIGEKGAGVLQYPWPNDMVLYYQRKFIAGYALVSAWQEVPKSAIAAVLDTIRTRVLNMALEIKAELGSTNSDLERITPQEANEVDQTIVNNIYGGNVYVAAGQSTMNATTIQQQQNIVAGDWEHLAKVLRTAGVSEPELNELSTAVKEDGKSMGAKVKGWIEKAAPKVLSGGVKIGVSVGQTLLVEYLKQYYGLS